MGYDIATAHNRCLEKLSNAINTNLMAKETDCDIVRTFCTPEFEWRPASDLARSLPPCDSIEEYSDFEAFREDQSNFILLRPTTSMSLSSLAW